MAASMHGATFGGDVERVAVEENLALFLVVPVEPGTIQYAKRQALWTDVPLTSFVRGAGHQQEYLRLDYDLSAVGPLLKEPQPHVHVEADGEPRFPVPVAGDDLVGWFLDFVYRNFFYDVWILWAEGVWQDWCAARDRPNRWARLKEAFGIRARYASWKRTKGSRGTCAT